MLDPAHGGMHAAKSELCDEARAARKWAIHSSSTATAHCSAVEHSTLVGSAASTCEFEKALGRVLGQCFLQVPFTQQLTARHRMFRKGAAAAHKSDLAGLAFPPEVTGINPYVIPPSKMCVFALLSAFQLRPHVRPP